MSTQTAAGQTALPAASSRGWHERTDWLAHAVIWAGVLFTAFPLYLIFVASTLPPQEIAQAPMPLLPGGEIAANYSQALFTGSTGRYLSPPVMQMMWNSLVMALVITFGKIVVSVLSAYAVVFFRFPLRMFFFWMIFITLMLPVEVRIVPTYKVVSDLGMLDTYAGLTIPLIASATATLLFRQFFLTIPDELVEAAKIDGAGPMRFFRDIVLPLSRTNIAALFVILFIYGWNQYLWPLLMTTSKSMDTIVIGIKKMIGTGDALTDWHIVMATTMLAMLPPVLVVVLMQRAFVRGLVETEK
jgi:sn-glycerol 3-phosphate transport system permease protein